MTLRFQLAKTQKDLTDIYNYNMSAFFDAYEFHWSLPWLVEQKQEGWSIHQVYCAEQIIAAIFTKVAPKGLMVKQTPLKFEFQGQGLSHKIKQHIELVAKRARQKNIFHYCAIDNFRMTALNESHGYHKTGGTLKNENIVEWHKAL